MPGMKLFSSLPLNQIRYPPGGPQPSTVTQHLGTFFQSTTQLFQLGRHQPRLATGSACLMQRADSLFAPCLVPPTYRLPVNLQPSGYLALTQSSVEKLGGLESPPFQFIKIAFNAFWIAHAQRLARVPKIVTILCDTQ